MQKRCLANCFCEEAMTKANKKDLIALNLLGHDAYSELDDNGIRLDLSHKTKVVLYYSDIIGPRMKIYRATFSKKKFSSLAKNQDELERFIEMIKEAWRKS